MADDLGFDVHDILDLIEEGDVILARFQLLEQRLLLDLRHSDTEGPIIAVVPRAGSAEERFRSLKQLRPQFPMPDRIMSFQWPRDISMLQTTGVWQRIRDRLAHGGHPETDERCEEIYRELLKLEHVQVVAAIRGDNSYKTIWQRAD